LTNCCKSLFVICEGIPNCLTELTIKTPIISGVVNLRFVDKFNKIFYVTKNSDPSGNVIIASDDLPIGFLNPYADAIKLFVLDNNSAQIPWVIDGTTYDAVAFTVSNTVLNSTSFTLNPFIS